MPKSDWDAISEGQISMALSDWADINKTISNFCSAPHINCDYQISPGKTLRQIVNDFFFRIELASGRRFQYIK